MNFFVVVGSIAGALSVFVIATITLGREARRLDAVAPRAVYELDEAVSYVSNQIPEATQARLTEDELRALLVRHMQWLHEKGLQPDKVVDRPQDIAETVVVEDTTVAALLLGEASRIGVDVLDDVDIVHVVDAHLSYFDAIGAVGPKTIID